MLLRDLTKAYISRNTPINQYGEYVAVWNYLFSAYFNVQQDLDQLDVKTSGEVDYGIIKLRTTKRYEIQKGDGISFSDISNEETIIPEYRVLDISKIGMTYVYRLEAYNGD